MPPGLRLVNHTPQEKRATLWNANVVVLMIRRISTAALSLRKDDLISPSEFLNALTSIWRPQEASGRLPQATKIGMLSAGLV